MQRIIVGCRRRDDETMEEFMVRSARTIAEWRERLGIMRWGMHYHTLVRRWAGHVARFEQTDPDRLTLRITAWKDYRWLRAQEKALE
eukprot:3458595-Lingulodinium_polyedra.AAC.1